ncbi:MAG: ABC transporter substrate-binding protein [Spirochaetaceae bacterium]
MPKRLIVVLGIVVVVVIVVALVVTQTGDEAAVEDEEVTIEYVLWDASQLPAYEEVADAFMEEHPEITIEINQLGWGDYWDDLTRRLATGDGPDVWTNHVAYFLEFVNRDQMMDIEERVQNSDLVDLDAYMEGLADLFVVNGARYGLPKDWDTNAIVYNRSHLEEAGVSEEEIQEMTWNPDDGGTFEEILARLTIDADGNNALDDGFDADNIERHAFAPDYDGMGAWGRLTFSSLAVSTGWTYHNDDGTEFYFDDDRFISTIEWFRRMANEDRYMTSFEETDSVPEMLASEQVSMTSDGSWMMGLHWQNLGDDIGFAPQPRGPEGRRVMFNGLADAINAETEHPDEAWLWVEFLGSVEAQEMVAAHGVVFPAVASATEITLDVHEERGLDATAFTDPAFDPEATFLFPLTDQASEINSIMQSTFDQVFLEQVDTEEGLTSANQKINALF